MDPHIKHFIETHIDEIENNEWVSFWEQVVMEFPNNVNVAQIVDILYLADITDTTDIRFLLLDDYISKVIQNIKQDEQVPLSVFIDRIPLDRRFGFNLRQIQVYLISNIERWDCFISRGPHGMAVRRK